MCGAAGFIGRNLVERLAAQPTYHVVALQHTTPSFSRAGVEWRQADLRNPKETAAALHDVDIVIQAAASTSGSKDTVQAPHMHITDNAIMNSVLLRAAFESRVRHFVFFSCSIMYPNSERPLREADFDPRDPLLPQYYGGAWTKVYFEKMCEFYSQIGAARFTVIRHSNVYGPHDKFDLGRSHVLGATITKVLESPGPSIVVWGDGSESRDFLYVDDLLDFVQLSLERQQRSYELMNAGSGESVSVSQLVHRIMDAAGKSLDVRHDLTAPTIRTSVCLDCSRAKEVLGWTPSVALDEGIRRTLAWQREAIKARHGSDQNAS